MKDSKKMPTKDHSVVFISDLKTKVIMWRA